MKTCKILSVICLTIFLGSCDDYLDVIPDNIPNMDHVFATEEMAESYLATLYTTVPEVKLQSMLFLGAEDLWTYTIWDNLAIQPSWRLARGEQNTNSPLQNAWDGGNGIKNLWQGIWHCNTFIEEISKSERVPELSDFTRKRWIAEAKFIKAYLYFYLFRMYGPLPINDVNIPASAGVDKVRVKRDPVDRVVQYISDLLSDAAPDLPLVIQNTVTENGRVSRGAAYMLKAKLWVTAASDLFNGNPDYSSFIDHDGQPLFPKDKDPLKWVNAVEACEEALDNLSDKQLYYYNDNPLLSSATTYQMNLRCAITERYNDEIIWALYTPTATSQTMQISIMTNYINPSYNTYYFGEFLSPTLSIVERFYTKNGVPLDEDNTYDYIGRYAVASAEFQGYNVQDKYLTAKLNLDRENRFYASMAFDGALVYLNNSRNDNGKYPIRAKYGEHNGFSADRSTSTTGYSVIKLTNPEFTHNNNTTTPASVGNKWYPWPEFRLADLYLLYAEALCEIGDLTTAKEYVDQVRKRSGLKGVDEAWQQYSNKPDKPFSQSGLREIIRQEREIELAFEGHHIWDSRRWKKAADYQNRPIQGWNVIGSTATDYYQVFKLFDMKFITPRDYLWPISNYSMQRNPNLVQNPGW